MARRFRVNQDVYWDRCRTYRTGADDITRTSSVSMGSDDAFVDLGEVSVFIEILLPVSAQNSAIPLCFHR